MKSKHYPYFKPTTLCKHCGEPIAYQRNEGLYAHDWDRWEGDNGYWCRGDNTEHSATPKKEEYIPVLTIGKRGDNPFIIKVDPGLGLTTSSSDTILSLDAILEKYGSMLSKEEINKLKREVNRVEQNYESIQEDNKK
jgi:hypothetical protein